MRVALALVILLASCGGPSRAPAESAPGESTPGESSPAPAAAPATSAAVSTDELPCLPIVSGCGCSYDCAQALSRNPDGSYQVDLSSARLERATLGRLCLPDGRCRDAFEDGTPCGGECIPTDAHFACHRDGDRCVP